MDNFVGASVRSVLHLIVYGEKHCQMHMGPEGRVLSPNYLLSGRQGLFWVTNHDSLIQYI